MARSFTPGSTTYLVNTSAVATAPPLTMVCWFRATSFPNNKTLISISDPTHAGDRVTLSLAGSEDANRPVLATVANAGELAVAESGGGYLANAWYFAAAVFASDTERWAYFGNSSGTDTTSLAFPAGLARTTIGALSNSALSEIMQGDIAEAAIWDVALTDTEIRMLRSGIPAYMVQPQSLIHYWPLLGQHSPEIDRQGGVDLTLSGGVGVSRHSPIRYPPAHRLLYGASIATFAPITPERYLVINQGRVQQASQRYLTLVDGVPEPEAQAGYVILYIDSLDGELKAKDSAGNVSTLSTGL